MDDEVVAQLHLNSRRFRVSLERIAEKYCRLQDEHGAIEVDLNNTSIAALESCLTLSKKNLDKMKSMGFEDSTEDSVQDITQDPLLENTCNERSCNFRTTNLLEVTQSDVTRNTCIQDEGQSNSTILSVQPEDQDEELEVSLQSLGSSLGDRYPGMVHQIENAWRRQHVSEAAYSVRRRYRRWRKSNRMHLAVSSHNDQSRSRESFDRPNHCPKSQVKSQSSVTKLVPQSPVNPMTASGMKSKSSCNPLRRSEPRVVAMNMPAIFKESERALNRTSKRELFPKHNLGLKSPEKSLTVTKALLQSPIHVQKSHPPVRSEPSTAESAMPPVCLESDGVINKTFTVSKPSLLRSTLILSPSKSSYSPNKLFHDLNFKTRGKSPCFMTAASSSADERAQLKKVYTSPVKGSPFKSKLTASESPLWSPNAQVASPKSLYMKQGFSKDLRRSDSSSNFVLTPSKLAVPKRLLDCSDRDVSPRRWTSHYVTPIRYYPRLRRSLSFDSNAQPSSSSSHSSKDFDDDFTMLYHKLVCLSKHAFLKGHPCRFCAKSSESGRGSLSNLAALALSPHRPLKKRQGDLQSYPQSKRFRDGHSFRNSDFWLKWAK